MSDMKKVGSGGDKPKGSSMQDAVSGTEAIRQWRDHYDGIEALCKKYTTDKDKGLSDDECKRRIG